MGIGITHEHQELARSVRGWLTRAVPPGDVRKLLDAPRTDDPPGRPAHWDAAAAQGLLGIHLPERYGGGGGTLLELAVALEETGAALLPGPYPGHALAAEVLRRTAHHDLVAALADGRRVAAAAFGPGGLTAVRDADGGLVVDGTAPPVLGGGHADLLLIAAVTADGTVWAAADADAFAVRVHESADPTRPTAEVTAAAVRVPASRVLDPAAADPGLVRDLAGVLLAAEACGVAARALTTAVEHAKVREQFGSPIGRFQAVKHLCADMLIRLERARALTWDAAIAAGAGDPFAGPADPAPRQAPGAEPYPARALTAAFAAATALDASYTCAKDCIQILGGTGFTWEHDAHLLLRRAVVARQLTGPADEQLLRAARLAAAGARRELRTELPPEAAAHRLRVRPVIAAARGLDPAAARRALAPTGLAAPHLPPPYGLGAGPVEQLAVQRELADAGVTLSGLSIGAWVVPSLLAHGTPEQQERLVPGTLRGELRWCQLFSEPGAGSDLASLTTRAERTPDGRWRITGQKVWTSAAHKADHGILLARTDPEAPRHRGLTYFVVDLRACEGVTIRPLREITGDSVFNEVWFDGTLLPADAVVGEVGDGWRVARNTLGNERVHMADQMAFDSGLEALLAAVPGLDGARRARIGALAAEAHALNCLALRTTLRQVSGLEPGPGASVRKLVQTLHQQKTAELGLELLGPAGAVAEGAGEGAVRGLLMSRCLTIAGGTTQVQLNVVAERILGLPRD
ncbi:acyl-CoA dehydrogenase [Streptomyces tsukubensis]|uniref:Acyl-CoA dehydrogenase n=3 Tax=Streptomyces TaxID=1883 RepID=A0A7G3UM75_STRT9|nr:acyl-CoA dehydrogenase [Streptomyces tsukubensis]AZK93869.1 acyl-CoA dehydrogenase [Streptomyces tsukubensis]QKM70002.1 acyl-CoA dehydrogenase [Streptomyces tsukubensis NRRL18488]TAI46019.1 acyl-CoA dehydrogenase [Streptomyces tsukubensis]